MSVSYLGSNPVDRTLAHLPDGELVELAQRGRRAAFESLYFRHQDRIYTLAYGVVGNEADAKDVVQETFFKTYMRLAKLRKDGAVLAYLCRTATNAAIDVLRAKRVGQVSSLDAGSGIETPTRAPGPEAIYERTAAKEAVALGLLALSAEHRLVLVLHHLNGMPLEEIAEKLRVPVGTVKSRLGRAREALKRKLIAKVGA